MEVILPVIIGGLYASGLYMMLQRSLVRMIIGLILISHASNFFLFVVSRITRGKPALIPDGMIIPPGDYADPFPQALVLTAIVIGFGIQAFAIVLIKRTYQRVGTDDLDDLNTTDEVGI
jgi:multicomponent Na+:H+ antiporter subunit C